MTDWSWLSGEGNVGEVPVEVCSGGLLDILPGYAEDYIVRRYDVEQMMTSRLATYVYSNAKLRE